MDASVCFFISVFLLKELDSVIKEERLHPAHTEGDAFILAIFSHGAKGRIFGIDGRDVKIEAIKEAFDGKHCKSLAGKPKLFIIQACQGSEYLYF